MDNEPYIPFAPDHPRFLKARALAVCIAAIRKAQGKKNPDDYAVSSPDWQAVAEDFARDVQRALGGDAGNLDRDFG